MQTKKLAVASALGVVAVAALLLAYPAMAASQNAPSTQPNIQKLMQQNQDKADQKVVLTAGQTITLNSIAGGYREVGNRSVNGNASGSMTLKVTGAFVGGYALSVTGGTLSINGNSLAITNGSAELGPYGEHMVGQGQAGTAQFLFSLVDLGKFGSQHFGILRVDVNDGSSQFLARLLVTISA